MGKVGLSRREMMIQCGALGIGSLCAGRIAAAPNELPANARVITRGPKHHWFGYYDKFEFDPSDRYVLGMEVDFEHRSPRTDDEIRVGMVDLADGDRWIDLGSTTAWCWQQGCMLQWLPGSASKIIWNDREDGRYVARILDVTTGKQRTVPHPVYTVSGDGKVGLTPDFRRIADVRPGYGYVGLPDPYAHDLAPKESGIIRVDLESGQGEMILSIADIVAMGTIPKAAPGIKHHAYHLLFNPDSSRFVFLHRWNYPNGTRLSRMITANPDGSDVRILDDNGLTSHFIWRDERHILAWSDQPSHGPRLYMFEDGSDKIEAVAEDAIRHDGHCNYLPGGEWILDDTYPDAERNQEVFLYHPETKRRVTLGRFHSPAEYTGEWRCDTHPRVSRSGRMLAIDSPYQDEGRQLHLMDLSGVIG
ncbi:MAG: hypothetical protein WD851_24610 [Pirellulales bacterium]